jgi:hypothetical protein
MPFRGFLGRKSQRKVPSLKRLGTKVRLEDLKEFLIEISQD